MLTKGNWTSYIAGVVLLILDTMAVWNKGTSAIAKITEGRY
jgi:hypothetical protein